MVITIYQAAKRIPYVVVCRHSFIWRITLTRLNVSYEILSLFSSMIGSRMGVVAVPAFGIFFIDAHIITCIPMRLHDLPIWMYGVAFMFRWESDLPCRFLSDLASRLCDINIFA